VEATRLLSPVADKRFIVSIIPIVTIIPNIPIIPIVSIVCIVCLGVLIVCLGVDKREEDERNKKKVKLHFRGLDFE
jgi:hypothetical protein